MAYLRHFGKFAKRFVNAVQHAPGRILAVCGDVVDDLSELGLGFRGEAKPGVHLLRVR
jgi:hypothetical protein